MTPLVPLLAAALSLRPRLLRRANTPRHSARPVARGRQVRVRRVLLQLLRQAVDCGKGGRELSFQRLQPRLRLAEFGLRLAEFGLRLAEFGLRLAEFGLRLAEFGEDGGVLLGTDRHPSV